MPGSVIRFVLGLLALAGSASLLGGCGRGQGAELLLEAKGGGASDQAMEKARTVIERRIEAFGASGATVKREEADFIRVTLARADEAEPVKALVRRRGRLEFWLVDTSVTPGDVEDGSAPPGARILPFANDKESAGIAVSGRPIVTGASVADARQGFDARGEPTVTVRFDAAAARRFARATSANVGRQLAIVLDDSVISAPAINEPILGGEAMIGGNLTPETAKALSITLRSGALPVEFTVIEERVTGR